MRVFVDLSSHLAGASRIMQADVTEEPGTQVVCNGKFPIPVLLGEINVNPSSYVLPVDGGDVSSQAAAQLLKAFPTFKHAYFNPLLEVADLNGLDSANPFVVGTTTYRPRVQLGAPAMVALLPNNNTVTPARPGAVSTVEVDLSSDLLCDGVPVGVTTFLPFWKLYEYDTSIDVTASSGFYAGQNLPAHKHLIEIEQNPLDFSAYLSPDGVSWCKVSLLQTVVFAQPTTKIRMAFVNSTSKKLHLNCYGVLF